MDKFNITLRYDDGSTVEVNTPAYTIDNGVMRVSVMDATGALTLLRFFPLYTVVSVDVRRVA